METKTVAKATTPRRVVIGDFAVVKYATISEWLKKDGMVAETVGEAEKFIQRLTDEFFDICVVNLLMGGSGPFQLIEQIRKVSKNRDIKILVVSKQVQKVNIQNTIRAGANDFIAEPFEVENLYHRVLYHLTPGRVVSVNNVKLQVNGPSGNLLQLLLNTIDSFSQTEREVQHKALYQTLKEIALIFDSNRTSLILVEMASDSGVVLGSSDDANFKNFPIKMAKYPEVSHVVNAGQVVLVQDTAKSTLTQQISEEVKTIRIGSVMVFPVRYQNDVIGALTIRRPNATEAPPAESIAILQAIANSLAAQTNVEASLRKIYKDFPKKVA